MSDFVTWEDFIGYSGGAVTVWAMHSKTMIPLRLGVVCGNVTLLLFGLFATSWPTVALHTVLLPLNSLRLLEMIRLVRQMRDAKRENPWEPLLPYMRRKTVPIETVFFRKDDPSDHMMIIESGAVFLEEIGVELRNGDVLGEMGLFTPDNKRTCTAIAKTDCVVNTISNDALLQLFYQNPRFGVAMVRIIVRRLLENWQSAEARARAAKP